MRGLDRALCVLLMLGGVGHTLGSFKAYEAEPMMLLWSLCASLFVFFFAAVNLVRAGRPGDKTLAGICLVGGVCWIAASLRFGMLIGNVWDFRPLIFAVITVGCACGRWRGGRVQRVYGYE
jgi:hypothetical protein